MEKEYLGDGVFVKLAELGDRSLILTTENGYNKTRDIIFITYDVYQKLKAYVERVGIK